VTTTAGQARHRVRDGVYALAVTPLLRWLVAHHAVASGTEWRTRCDTCAGTLWPAACGLSGRCGTCRARIGAPPYWLEVGAAAAFGLLVGSGVRGWELAAYTWWTAGMLVLAFVDAAVLRLPHRLTATTTAGTIVLLAPLGGPASSWWSAIVAAATLAAFYAVVRLVSRGDLGLGDVALAVPVGFGAGWYDWRLAVAAVLVGHSLAAAGITLRRVTGSTSASVPLGSYLVAASVAVVVHRVA